MKCVTCGYELDHNLVCNRCEARRRAEEAQQKAKDNQGIDDTSFKQKLIDEESGVWIKIFKGIIVCLSIALFIGGFIMGIELSTEDNSVFLLYFIIGIVAALIQYIFGMLLVNFFNNVQLIREHLLSMTFEEDKSLEDELPNL